MTPRAIRSKALGTSCPNNPLDDGTHLFGVHSGKPLEIGFNKSQRCEYCNKYKSYIIKTNSYYHEWKGFYHLGLMQMRGKYILDGSKYLGEFEYINTPLELDANFIWIQFIQAQIDAEVYKISFDENNNFTYTWIDEKKRIRKPKKSCPKEVDLNDPEYHSEELNANWYWVHSLTERIEL